MKNENKIIAKYPELFGKPPFDHTITLIGFGFEVDDGWEEILVDLFEKISKIVKKNNLNDFRIIQVKEKFGGLRVYVKNPNEEIRDLICKAESAAAKTCSVCGKFGKLRTHAWARTLCDECENDR